jgi:cyclopropane fatty-acyl-phospholipid synthase-like methyltransferase
MFPGQLLHYLDLGCAGGGLVLDFLLRGHPAVGIEGSDYSLLEQRAEWRLLADRALFTADVTHPFAICLADGSPFQAHVATAWDLMEHLAEDDLPAFFANLRKHLRRDGRFVGSISTRPADGDMPGRTCDNYHRTVRPEEWWTEQFRMHGFALLSDHGLVPEDFARGTGRKPYAGESGGIEEACFLFVAALRERTDP